MNGLITGRDPGRYEFVNQAPTIQSPMSSDYVRNLGGSGSSFLHNWMVANPYWNYSMQEDNEVPVTQNSVLSIAPMWRASNILCGLMGRIPCRMYRRGKNDTRERATDDRRYHLVYKKPNLVLKSRTWKSTTQLHKMIAPGGAFTEIIRDQTDEENPVHLVPLDPNRMAWGVITRNGVPEMVYMYQDDPFLIQEPRPIPVRNVIHIKGLSYDAVMGIDMVDQLSEEFGLILHRRKYANHYFINNANIKGFLMIPAGFDLKWFSQLMETIDSHLAEQHKDPLKVAPLFEGVKYQPTQDNPQESQLSDSIKMTPETCSVITGVPGFLLGADTRDSYKSLEEVMRSFFTTTVDDNFDEFESEFNDKLLTDEESRSDELYFEFSRKKLLQTDIKSFHDLVRRDFHSGIMAWEEARQAHNMPTETEGLTFYLPKNIMGSDPQSPKQGESTSDAQGALTNSRAALRTLALATAKRVCQKIYNAINNRWAIVEESRQIQSLIQWHAEKLPDVRKMQSDEFKLVYDLALANGFIDGAPEFDIVEKFELGLSEVFDMPASDLEGRFKPKVMEVVRNLRKELPQQFANLVTGK